MDLLKTLGMSNLPGVKQQQVQTGGYAGFGGPAGGYGEQLRAVPCMHSMQCAATPGLSRALCQPLDTLPRDGTCQRPCCSRTSGDLSVAMPHCALPRGTAMLLWTRLMTALCICAGRGGGGGGGGGYGGR